jgi:hypothetical protein
MPYFVFSTYEDTRVDWLFEADSLDDARRRVTDDTLDDVISDEGTRCIGSATVESRELCTDSGDPADAADIQEINPCKETWAVRDLEEALIEDARKKPLPESWPVDSDLTRFDGFEVHPVRQHRDWSGKADFYCEQCDGNEQPTFWTVYGHYDPSDERNAMAGLVGVEALIDCWSLADAERLLIMFEQFRAVQIAARAKSEAAA